MRSLGSGFTSGCLGGLALYVNSTFGTPPFLPMLWPILAGILAVLLQRAWATSGSARFRTFSLGLVTGATTALLFGIVLSATIRSLRILGHPAKVPVSNVVIVCILAIVLATVAALLTGEVVRRLERDPPLRAKGAF